MIDRSLDKGLSDFFFVESDETDLIYDFVSFMDIDGVILLARFPKDGSSGRYWVGVGDFAIIWAAKATKSYKLPNELKKPRT